MTRLTSLIFAVALLASCVANHSLTTGQPCPCAPGWSCDAATNKCVASSVDAGTERTDATPVESCPCDTNIHTTALGQTYVTVSRDCFCATRFGFLCRDFDQAAALCSRTDVHQVSGASFAGCASHGLNVTIGSVEKGRPTYAGVWFHGNSFFSASYEADLICNNLPADEANDARLGVKTDDSLVSDPSCGSIQEWNVCETSAGDGGMCPSSSGPCGGLGQVCCFNLEASKTCSVRAACVRQVIPGCEAGGAMEICVDCGQKGQPCCGPGGGCDAGLACDYPTDDRGIPTGGTPTCTDSCGAEGSRCCGALRCQEGLHCFPFDTTGTCGRCGNPGEACCATQGDRCSNSECNDAGICETPDAF